MAKAGAVDDPGSLAENPVSKDEQWLLCTSALGAVFDGLNL
jgi:hypothetical protein